MYQFENLPFIIILCLLSISGSINPFINRFNLVQRDLKSIYKIKTGAKYNREVFWTYKGVIINSMNGIPITSIIGLERVTPILSNQNSSKSIRFNSTDMIQSYISDKSFIFTELGKNKNLIEDFFFNN